jgi:hypothetical protein
MEVEMMLYVNDCCFQRLFPEVVNDLKYYLENTDETLAKFYP